MRLRVELLVFDWDGTLMDSEARIVASMSNAIDGVGLPARATEEIREIIGLGLPEATARLFPAAGVDQRQALIGAYRHQFLHECRQQEQLFEGATGVLGKLRDSGFRLAVATGKSRAGLDRVLQSTGTAGFFEATRCADESISKPHPQMLEELMLELAVEPAATIMVGDTEFDLQMARNAGAHSLAASYGAHATDRLRALSPLALFHDLRDLPGLLNSIGVGAVGRS